MSGEDTMEPKVIDEPRDLAAVEPTNPLMLLQQAVDRGMDPAQLQALVDLHEQWRAARAKEAFSAAMNAVQVEMPVVVRDAQNTQTKSNYIRLETLTHRAKPIYTGHGFSLSFSESECPRQGWHRITCTIRHVAGHSETHWIDLPTDGIGPKGNAIGGMNAVQGAISTGSYGQRVLTCRVFNITVADTDLDGVPPPEHPNPPANGNAPTAQPRGQRQQSVTREQCGELLAAWKALPGNQSEASGDVAKWHGRFFDWAKQIAGRDFDPSKAANWTAEDYRRVDAALAALEGSR